MKLLFFLLGCWAVSAFADFVDYTGHKVITALPKSESELELIRKFYDEYSVDLWNEPRTLGSHIMMHLKPNMIEPVEKLLNENKIEYDVAYEDLQRAIDMERNDLLRSPSTGAADGFNFSRYNTYQSIVNLLKNLTSQFYDHTKLEIIGKSYENRPIYSVKISKGDSLNKPVIMMECGIHAREWISIASCTYFVNKLITKYGTDEVVTNLVDKYEYNIILVANPDGYVFTWEEDRTWRKSRSRSRRDVLGFCIGTDINRNFDIDHCGIGTSRRPCDIIYCGDKPFSESEARALRDFMWDKKHRMAAYFSLHAFSQLWMTPYGINNNIPPNYSNLTRVGQIGVDALAKKYGTQYKLGRIANIIYPATGSSVDYVYEKVGIKMAFALELRDKGKFGFLLPANLIIPTSEETYNGLVAAMQAL